MDKRTADVVIVGAASPEVHWPCGWRAGLAVTVLEQAAEYRDRVRGETMFPWCCAELVESGLLDIAMRAEGTVATRVAPYGDSMSPTTPRRRRWTPRPWYPASPGCSTSVIQTPAELTQAAAESGAEVVRGVRGVHVTAGRNRPSDTDESCATRSCTREWSLAPTAEVPPCGDS